MTSTTKGQQLTKEAADLIMAKVHEGKTIDEAVKELTTANTEHEPVARGGEDDEWIDKLLDTIAYARHDCKSSTSGTGYEKRCGISAYVFTGYSYTQLQGPLTEAI